jgi:hypothetical protein
LRQLDDDAVLVIRRGDRAAVGVIDARLLGQRPGSKSSGISSNALTVLAVADPSAPTAGMKMPAASTPIPTLTATKAARSDIRCGIDARSGGAT